MRWTDSDNLRSRDALVVGGPSNGLLIPAREQNGRVRYPDVIDLTGYVFDADKWEFHYRASEAGQTLIEWMLVGVLVAIVSLGTLHLVKKGYDGIQVQQCRQVSCPDGVASAGKTCDDPPVTCANGGP